MTFKFDHVHLVCEDVEGMMAFFERIFEAKRIGLVPDFKGSASGILELAGIRIFVRGMRPDWIPGLRRTSPGPGVGPFRPDRRRCRRDGGNPQGPRRRYFS